MKKAISVLVAVMMCISLAVPAFAAEFVPSITGKNAPEIVSQVDENGDVIIGHILDEDNNIIDDIHDGEIVITPVSQAEGSDEIPEDAKDLLLELYEGLDDGTEKLPYGPDVDPNNMVIRDMVDISWVGETPDIVNPTGHAVSLTLDLGIAPDTVVHIFTYHDGEWIPARDVINNGDGTVKVVLENFGPVVFSVEAGTDSKPSQTGDTTDVTLWVVLLAVSAVALVTVFCFRRKFV